MPLTRPTTTPLPDEIYDEWAPRLSEAELKVLLYIVRRTLGFHKGADAISLTQFARGIVTRDGRVLDNGCGITSRATLVRALQGLEGKGLISASKGQTIAGDRDVTVYALSWADADTPALIAEGGSHPAPPGPDRQPGWCASRPEVVSRENYGGSPREPTTNSVPTNSQQDRRTTRAQAREPLSLDHSACPSTGTRLEGDDVWPAVVADLSSMMTAGNAALWLAPTRVLAREGDTLRVGVPSRTHQHWLDRRLRGKIEAALRRLGHGDLRLIVEVAP